MDPGSDDEGESTATTAESADSMADGGTDTAGDGDGDTAGDGDGDTAGDGDGDTAGDGDGDTAGDGDGDGDTDPGAPCTVFFTVEKHNGDWDGLQAADAVCQSEAIAAGLAGTYRAFLSVQDAGIDAKDRFVLRRSPIVLSGTPSLTIADDWSDLLDGGIQNPINRNADGSEVTSSAAWTGSNSDGTANGADCNGWTSGGGNSGSMGGTSATTKSWVDNQSGGCSNFNAGLYCFRD